jgi:hypothetical protein
VFFFTPQRSLVDERKLCLNLGDGCYLSNYYRQLVERYLKSELKKTLMENNNVMVDADLVGMSREWLVAEVIRLRAAIREHRDSTGHELCWHHPKLWELLPEKIAPNVAVPPWSKFMRGCIKYRESLDEQLPGAPVYDQEA